MTKAPSYVDDRETHRTDPVDAPPPARATDLRGLLSRRPALPVIVLTAGWVLVCGLMLRGAWLSRFTIGNIDGISYLSIARQYAEGSWLTAVNAFWSPALSWGTAALIRVGLPDTLSLLLVNVAGAAVGVAVGTWLVWHATRRHFWASALFLAGSSVFYLAAVYLSTPDLLVVTWVVLLVAVLHRMTTVVREGPTRTLMLMSALLGALCCIGYVVKLYLVPVMVVTIPLWLWWALAHRGTQERVTTLREGARTASGVLMVVTLTAAALSAPWVATLSSKYDRFTLGSSLTVNMESKFKPASGAEVTPELQMWVPPNDQAVSYGEDRTFRGEEPPSFRSSEPWSERIAYYLQQRVEAFPYYLNRTASLAPFAVGTTAVYLVLLGLGRFRGPEFRLATVAALVWTVYFAGYAAITSTTSFGGNPRYYWPSFVIWLVFVCALLPAFWAEFGRGRGRGRRALALLVVVAVPLSAVWQFGFGRAAPFTTSDPPRSVQDLFATVPQPGTVRDLALSHLSAVVEPGDRVVGSNYRTTTEMAYYLRAQVYGRSAQPYDPADPRFRSLLRQYDIGYYLYYQPLSSEPEPPEGLAEVGPTVAQYDAVMPCRDVAGTPPELCRLVVVEVAGP